MMRVACPRSARRFTRWLAMCRPRPCRETQARRHPLCISSIESLDDSRTECPTASSIHSSNGANSEEFAMTGFSFSIQDHIARIVFNRPDEQNLLSRDLLLALRAITSDLAANPEVRVLTLTAEGTECFSTGILTPTLRGQLAKDEVLRLIRLANETFDAIEALPQIVIAG